MHLDCAYFSFIATLMDSGSGFATDVPSDGRVFPAKPTAGFSVRFLSSADRPGWAGGKWPLFALPNR